MERSLKKGNTLLHIYFRKELTSTEKAVKILNVEDGLNYLIEFLINSSRLPKNKIKAVKWSLIKSKCGLKDNCDFKVYRLPNGG